MWNRIWCMREMIMMFLIRNLSNFKILANNISYSYWTENEDDREEQKNCERWTESHQDKWESIYYEAEAEK